MKTPIVSVLMTAYNRQQYIAEAIESVLASTFHDFELIIVDDSSTDGTVEVARRYIADPRVQVHVNERNLGDYPNRNRAASFARGRYLKYLDSDDVIYAHGLEVMVQAMERFPEAALGLSGPTFLPRPYPYQVEPDQAYRQHFMGGGLLSPGPTACILRTDVFRALNGFHDTRFAGDAEMWLRIASRYPIVLLMGGLVWWRAHAGQEYRRGLDSLAYASLDFHISMDALSDSFCPLSDRERRTAIRRVKHRQARLIWRLALRQRRLQGAVELYRDSQLTIRELGRGLQRPNGINQA